LKLKLKSWSFRNREVEINVRARSRRQHRRHRAPAGFVLFYSVNVDLFSNGVLLYWYTLEGGGAESLWPGAYVPPINHQPHGACGVPLCDPCNDLLIHRNRTRTSPWSTRASTRSAARTSAPYRSSCGAHPTARTSVHDSGALRDSAVYAEPRPGNSARTRCTHALQKTPTCEVSRSRRLAMIAGV